MSGVCLAFFLSFVLVVIMYRQIDSPDFIYLANMSRDQRKSAMITRIVILLSVWLIVGFILICYTLSTTPFG